MLTSVASVLLLRPEGDEVERQLSRWSEPFVRRLRHRPFVDLRGDDCTRARVNEELAPNQLLVYWGHGDHDRLGNPPLVDGDNIGRCRGGIVVAMACYSAIELGPIAVSSGVQAYLGYTTKLPVTTDQLELGHLAAEALDWLVRGASVGTGLSVLDAKLRGFAEASLARVPTGVAARVPEWLVAASLVDGLTVLPPEAGRSARLAR